MSEFRMPSLGADDGARTTTVVRGRAFRKRHAHRRVLRWQARGVLRVEELFSAQPKAVVGAIMDTDPPVVGPGVDQEKAAWKAAQHGGSALAVVNGEGRLIGFLTVACRVASRARRRFGPARRLPA